jgi:5-methylcytosine-specific restriction endonuclease McrA
MDVLAYWRLDNYRRDLDEGAGFHFNSKQRRLHTAIDVGETLWLFTRVVGQPGVSEYRIVAKLVVKAKTINAPGYKYGPFRVWGDVAASEYYRIFSDPTQDVFELLRILPLASGSLASCDRTTLPQAAQTMRGVKPAASELLRAFCAQLPIEARAKAVADEVKLERALASDRDVLDELLRDEHTGVSDAKRAELLGSYSRDRSLVEKLNLLYKGRCQLCAFDSPIVYGVESAESHHIHYRSRGGPDILENLVLVCPNHHTVIHRAQAAFDYEGLHFVYPNRRIEPLCLNEHLESRRVA